MARRLILALLVGLAPLSGCTTCDNPYDDCGPVIDANFHPAGFRSGSRPGAPLEMPTMAPETIPTPPLPPMDPSEGESDPGLDQPPEMEEMETTSVMRPRLRYKR